MKNIKSLGVLLLTAIIWGFAFVAQRVGAEYVGAFTFNGIRFALGAISLIPVILIFEKKDSAKQNSIAENDILHKAKVRKSLYVGLLAGTILFVASWLQQRGVEITKSSGKAGFITGLYTVLVPIFGIFLKKKTRWNIWVGAGFAVVGLFLLCINEKWQISYGDAVLLMGSVFWTFHILVIDGFGDKVYSLRFAFFQFVTCSVLSIVCSIVFETIDFAAIKLAIVPILYGGLMSVGVAYTCQIIGQKNADPTYASIILSSESMFAAIGGALILGETMVMRGYVGCGLMFAGIIISQIIPKKSIKQ